MNKFYLKEWHTVLKKVKPKGERINIKGYDFPLFSLDLDEMKIPLELEISRIYNKQSKLYNCLGIFTEVYLKAHGCGRNNCCPPGEFHETLFVDILKIYNA